MPLGIDEKYVSREKMQLLTQDFRGYLWDFLRDKRLKCLRVISTWIARFTFSAKGIALGAGSTFYGCPVIRRYPLSEIRIGKGCTFRSDRTSNLIGNNHRCILSTFSKTARIIIDNQCSFTGVVIGALESVSVGSNTLCGANVVITDFDWHSFVPQERRTSSGESEPVVIGSNVWLGLNVIVLKGVTIGENSVIGANSVVTKDIPANVIAAGNPCRVMRRLSG